jgi:hypothetical protein
MAEISENTPGDAVANPNALVNEYLLEHLAIYRELCELRRQASTDKLLFTGAPRLAPPSLTD